MLGEFSIDTAGMALDDDVEVECAVGRGHRLYSDRSPLECPCHWPAVRVVQVAWALQQGSVRGSAAATGGSEATSLNYGLASSYADASSK